MRIKKDIYAMGSYLEDSSNLKGGNAEEIVFPENIGELSLALRNASSTKTPVTVSGGGTGTAGARVPFGGIVISMEKFDRMHDISDKSMECSLEAGVKVEDLKNACEKKGLFYTSHPTEETAFVGGTVSTNASGSRSFKYGPTRRYVRRLTMVLANGEIFTISRGERALTVNNSILRLPSGLEIDIPLPSYKMPEVKNSAGYFAMNGMDAIDLFIGQEGTLSVITDMVINVVKKPDRIFSCFVFFRDMADAWRFAEEVRVLSKNAHQAEGPSIDALSIEYFDNNALRLAREKNGNIDQDMKAAIFFEQETSRTEEDAHIDKWLKLIKRHNASLDDTWVAMNEKEADDFMRLRHSIPESINDTVRRSGFRKLSTDIAVPERHFMEMMKFYVDALRSGSVENVVFGHIGECHVHVNLLPKSDDELKRAVETCLVLVKKGVSLGGTISAEHGVGKTKHKYLEIMYGRKGILEMAKIKKAFDPDCILGLDNIFHREILTSI